MWIFAGHCSFCKPVLTMLNHIVLFWFCSACRTTNQHVPLCSGVHPKIHLESHELSQGSSSRANLGHAGLTRFMAWKKRVPQIHQMNDDFPWCSTCIPHFQTHPYPGQTLKQDAILSESLQQDATGCSGWSAWLWDETLRVSIICAKNPVARPLRSLALRSRSYLCHEPNLHTQPLAVMWIISTLAHGLPIPDYDGMLPVLVLKGCHCCSLPKLPPDLTGSIPTECQDAHQNTDMTNDYLTNFDYFRTWPLTTLLGHRWP